MHHAAPIQPNLDAFHEADPRRLRSEQRDYGVHCRLDGWAEKCTKPNSLQWVRDRLNSS